jgi:hypothetical protein
LFVSLKGLKKLQGTCPGNLLRNFHCYFSNAWLALQILVIFPGRTFEGGLCGFTVSEAPATHFHGLMFPGPEV